VPYHSELTTNAPDYNMVAALRDIDWRLKKARLVLAGTIWC